MKIVVFSDIHGNGYSFDGFLDALSTIEYDEVIFLGDFFGYYYDQNRIIEYCIENNFICLRGNHDQYLLNLIDGHLSLDTLVSKYGSSYSHALRDLTTRDIDFIRNLPEYKVLKIDEFGALLFCHGCPFDFLEGRIYPDTDLDKYKVFTKDYRYIVSGNTHHKIERKLGETIFLNPGSLGQQRDGKGCSFLLIDTTLKTNKFFVVDYEISLLERDIDFYDSNNYKLKEVLRRRQLVDEKLV